MSYVGEGRALLLINGVPVCREDNRYIFALCPKQDVAIHVLGMHIKNESSFNCCMLSINSLSSVAWNESQHINDKDTNFDNS
jgi:hypothetical protein